MPCPCRAGQSLCKTSLWSCPWNPTLRSKTDEDKDYDSAHLMNWSHHIYPSVCCQLGNWWASVMEVKSIKKIRVQDKCDTMHVITFRSMIIFGEWTDRMVSARSSVSTRLDHAAVATHAGHPTTTFIWTLIWLPVVSSCYRAYNTYSFAGFQQSNGKWNPDLITRTSI